MRRRVARETILLAIGAAWIVAANTGYAVTVPAGGPAITAGVAFTNNQVAGDGTLFFYASDNVSLEVSVANGGIPDVLTSYGWILSPFDRMLVFTNQGGIVTRAPELSTETGTHVGPPSSLPFPDGSVIQVEGVERVYGTGSADPFDTGYPVANAYDPPYSLPMQAGIYTVKAVIPMRTYPAGVALYENPLQPGLLFAELTTADWEGVIESPPTTFYVTADNDGDGTYWPVDPIHGLDPALARIDCDDTNAAISPNAVEVPGNGIDEDCNPATVDGGPLMGTVSVRGEVHNVGTGNHPPSTKTPLGGLAVLVLDRSPGSCVAGIGISWQNYKAIFEGCNDQAKARFVTNDDGLGEATVPPGEYMLVGMYDPASPYPSGDEIYIGNSDVSVKGKQTTTRLMKLMTKADGKHVPAKYTVLTGTELIIIEPEYIQWTETEELYPFVFESVGEWGVTTTITPPEGFVADKPALSTDVNDDLQALQFVVTDVGSKWVDTKVVHTVKHKKKAVKIQSTIGVQNDQGEDDNGQGGNQQ